MRTEKAKHKYCKYPFFFCDEKLSRWVKPAKIIIFEGPELIARKWLEYFTLFNSGAL